MSKDLQASFLIEEYKNINGAISLNNANVVSGFKLYFGVLAALVGALMLGLARDVDADILILLAACSCSILLLFTLFSFIVLVQERVGYVKRLRALNCIRCHFKDLSPENIKYFSLPATTEPVTLNRISSSPAVWFMAGFSGVLAGCSVGLWLTYAVAKAWQVYSGVGIAVLLILIFQKIVFTKINRLNTT